jgi:uncharacterized protein
MFRRFLPYEASFFDYFEQHAALIIQTSEALSLLVAADANILLVASRIEELEHQADNITHRCIEALHKTFITPFERNDIYRLITRMDDIIDFIKDAAACIVLYKLREMTQGVQELTGILVRAALEVEHALRGLRTIEDLDRIKGAFISIHRLENEADVVVRYAIGRLFEEEEDTRTLIKWKEVYDNLENAVDSCEAVANIIEGVILENS